MQNINNILTINVTETEQAIKHSCRGSVAKFCREHRLVYSSLNHILRGITRYSSDPYTGYQAMLRSLRDLGVLVEEQLPVKEAA